MKPTFNPFPQQAADAVGGQSELARKLKKPLTPQAVGYWCRTGKMPAELVLEVETLSNVSRHDLRPDIYPRDTQAA